jgi:lipopolysaccharide biosynthesis glycosyltransferase
MENSEKIEIVACTDKWFVMPAGVMMYSVCVNNPDVKCGRGKILYYCLLI